LDIRTRVDSERRVNRGRIPEIDMAPKPAPLRRRAPDVLPDSLPRDDAPDAILPDEVRRRDEPDVLPDSLPARDKERTLEGQTPARDGGVAQHPIHDEDLEDLGPDDYQRQVDEIEEAALDRETKP
jgi:hypothetical protein